MRSYPFLLVIAGTGRNSGKTTLACRLIQSLSKNQEIQAAKFTTHHQLPPGRSWSIELETDPPFNKDTGRMKQAGASRVWLIQADPAFAFQAFQEWVTSLTSNEVVICESNSLGAFIRPGLLILMNSNTHPTTAKPITGLGITPDLILDWSDLEAGRNIGRIEISPKGWILASGRG